MAKSKKVFLILAVIFFIAMVLIGVDISQKTSFPGSKKYLPEALSPSDSLPQDTTQTTN